MSFILKWFLPHYYNNYKAHLIRSYSLFGLSFLFIFFQVFLNFFLLANPSVLGFSANISPERIIELTNLERVKTGSLALKENKLLSEAARQKAADMFAFNYWAHISPSGRTPWVFFTDVGYKYQHAGENLARDFKDPDSVIRAWMNSSSHRENILNPKYQEIGVAVVDGSLQGVETTLVVQLFGTPYGLVAERPLPEKEKETAKAPEQEKAPLSKPQVATKEVLSKGFLEETPITSPFDLTKVLIIFIVGVLIGVFVMDFILVSHHHTPRLSSRSFAQMMFLIFILIASMLIHEGAIL